MPRPAVAIPLFFADLIGGCLGIYPGPRDFGAAGQKEIRLALEVPPARTVPGTV
jgi:hypothetical protein